MIDYSELLSRYNSALSEIERLKKENSFLRTRLLNKPESDQETIRQNTELLKNAGITVRFKSDFHQKFTVIDNQTVWYGSVNFLSFGAHDESIMRFENPEIAGALIDTVIN